MLAVDDRELASLHRRDHDRSKARPRKGPRDAIDVLASLTDDGALVGGSTTRSVIFSHCSMGAAPTAVDLGFSKPSVDIRLTLQPLQLVLSYFDEAVANAEPVLFSDASTSDSKK